MPEPSAAVAVEVPPEKGTPEYNEAMSKRFEKGFDEGENKQTFEAPPAEINPIPANLNSCFKKICIKSKTRISVSVQSLWSIKIFFSSVYSSSARILSSRPRPDFL